MYLKFVRLVNFYGGLLSTIAMVTIYVVLITLVTSSEGTSVVLDGLVELSFSGGIFLGVYLIRLNFRKAKYPFISSEDNGFHNSLLEASRNCAWLGLIAMPCLLAVVGPSLGFFSTYGTIEASNYLKMIRGVVFGGSSLIMIINNLVYVQLLGRKQNKMQLDFSLQRLS